MIKIGVIGVGHLGAIHLRLLKEIGAFDVVGIYDTDAKRAAEMAQEYGVEAFADLNALIDAVDAVDIVTPTTTHFEIAKTAMKRFKHVFIEKPVTHTVEEAKTLINLAREAKIKAMVGHVERFNPGFLAVKNMDIKPMFIESHRLSTWTPRGTDVSVILDLMIHDIDIILSVVNSNVKRVSAVGVPVISDTPDIANARIEFDNGCVANLTASRVALKQMRRIRIFQRNSYYSIDFLGKDADIFHINDESAKPDPNKTKFEFKAGNRTKYLSVERPKIEPVNSIKMELEDFARAIREDGQPSVTLEQATKALETAYLIAEKINDLCIA
jgi:predicted dehydrogenase